jgi:hypothetical protein
MWRFGFLVIALLATPAMAPRALAQTLHYDNADRETNWHGHEGHHGHRGHGGQRRVSHRMGDLSGREIDPMRLGPAPASFLYHCDAPAGFYPYVPTCRMPWRVVPSGTRR